MKFQLTPRELNTPAKGVSSHLCRGSSVDEETMYKANQLRKFRDIFEEECECDKNTIDVMNET